MNLDREIAKRLGLDFGADDCVIISSNDVILDPRVRFKCMAPKCYMSGVCSHCPPHGYSLSQIKQLVSAHEWAIFFRVKIPPDIVAAKSLATTINSGVMDSAGNLFNLGAHYLLTFSIIKRLQKQLNEMGYASHGGFAAGNCKDALCHFHPLCQDLTTSLGCRHPELSSPSMESCGMDAFIMAANTGWDVYPIGGACQPQSIPHGSLMGLVLLTNKNTPEPEFTLNKKKQSKQKKQNLPSLIKIRNKLKSASRSIAAIKQGNASLAQLQPMMKNRRVWTHFYKNLHAITGSWTGVLRKNIEMFTGRPFKE